MDETLLTLLTALERLDAAAVSDRLAAVDALTANLPRLSRLSSEEWDLKLADVEEDVADLREQASRAAARYEQARRALETLRRLAERADNAVSGPEPEPAGSDRRNGSFAAEERARADTDARHQTAVSQAETTRDAILQVMARRPNRQWTAQAVTEDLVRYGRAVERSNAQVTLRRLAADGKLRKTGRGAYQIIPGAAATTNDTVREKWLPVAEEAADAYLVSHPGEAERDLLIDEALLAIETYKSRHEGREPAEGEPIVRRVMKSRLYDVHRRIERRGQRVT